MFKRRATKVVARPAKREQTPASRVESSLPPLEEVDFSHAKHVSEEENKLLWRSIEDQERRDRSEPLRPFGDSSEEEVSDFSDDDQSSESSSDDSVIIRTEPLEVHMVQEDHSRRIYSPLTMMSWIPPMGEFVPLMERLSVGRTIDLFDPKRSNRAFERDYNRVHGHAPPRALKVHRVLRMMEDVAPRGSPFAFARRYHERMIKNPLLCRTDTNGRVIRLTPRRRGNKTFVNSCFRMLNPKTYTLKEGIGRTPKMLSPPKGFVRANDALFLENLKKRRKCDRFNLSDRYLEKYFAFFSIVGWYPMSVKDGESKIL